ncbi:MAG: FtsX-like permease family protein [Anaerolineales bacterium]|nr:FtsX-like permease family protein [Anaerolineales bacterium]
MRIILRVRAIFIVVAKHIFSQRGLILAAMFGLIIAIALIMSIPLYADSVYHRVFLENLSSTVEGIDPRPPFTFLFRYFGGWHGEKQWEDIEAVDEYLIEKSTSTLGLPERFIVRHFKTEPFPLFPEDQTVFTDTNAALIWASLGFFSDLEDHIIMQEGRFPNASLHQDDSELEVLVSEVLAEELGLQVGEAYIAYVRDQTQTGEEVSIQVPLRISGVWSPIDSEEDYWFISPSRLTELLIIPEGTFRGWLSSNLVDEIYTSYWYIATDGSEIRSSDAALLLRRIGALKQRAATLLPDIALVSTMEDALEEYQRTTRLLTILLFAFVVPIIGLILVFISMVAGLTIDGRRNEIAVMRSRGGSTLQIIGIVFLESLFLGFIALLISPLVGIAIAGFIGQATSFLEFTTQSDLQIRVTTTTIQAGLIAVTLAILAQVLPAVNASRQTIVTYKQEQARAQRPPFWKRAWLDVLLLIPAIYGAYLLREQGTIVELDSASRGDPFQNPLLFLVPALGILALTLLFLRLLPLLMAGVAWAASNSKSVGLTLAARHFARTPGAYSTPLILLVLTISLSAFTASFAYTLDNHLRDQQYYQVGADMNFLETGETTGQSGFSPGGVVSSPGEEQRWLFFPVSEYLRVQGVSAVTRVGRYPVRPNLSGVGTGEFLGIDRVDFPQVSFWRNDFAQESLGALMNQMAMTPNGVLVPRGFMHGNSLAVGDSLQLELTIYGQRVDLDTVIVGTFDLFPTWYPQEGLLFVGNLENLFEQVGGTFPYGVWLRTEPGFDPHQIEGNILPDLNVRILDWDSAPLVISEEKGRPERQGLFGLLSVGFASAAVLTVVGILLYVLFSYRRRFIELGVMRASGLSAGQMTVFLAWELIFLILIGAGFGTVLGLWFSNLFIPYLQIGVEAVARIPPYQVEIAWPTIFRIYGLFAILFVVTLITLVMLLRRMRIYEAIKLGETV